MWNFPDSRIRAISWYESADIESLRDSGWRHELGRLVQFCACRKPIITICRHVRLSLAGRIRLRLNFDPRHMAVLWLSVPSSRQRATVDAARYDIISMLGKRVTAVRSPWWWLAAWISAISTPDATAKGIVDETLYFRAGIFGNILRPMSGGRRRHNHSNSPIPSERRYEG